MSSPKPNSPNEPTEPPRRLRGDSGRCWGGFPLWKVRDQPSPGAQGGCQALPAMQKPREPGRVTHAQGWDLCTGNGASPSPSARAGLCWETESQFWVHHRGFIPALPHCIGKCNSLAWELGVNSFWREKNTEGGREGGQEGGWDRHPWAASPPLQPNAAMRAINTISSLVFLYFVSY